MSGDGRRDATGVWAQRQRHEALLLRRFAGTSKPLFSRVLPKLWRLRLRLRAVRVQLLPCAFALESAWLSRWRLVWRER